MPFRANEEIERGYQHALSYLLGPSVDSDQRDASRKLLVGLINAHGPVVSAYPHWHPLVSANEDERSPAITPSERCGYRGLDHTIFLRNGFITCPYANVQAVLDSVARVNRNPRIAGIATIAAEKLEVQLYHPNAQAILVTCDWNKPMNRDGSIPAAVAVPMILEREVPAWHWAQVAETWATMRPYLLGQPSGSRSSLFVDQETGQMIKDLWNTLVNSGMYGPIKAGRG